MFRFTIRDLLWLTVVVALAAAWWVDRGRLVTAYSRIHIAVQRGDYTAARHMSPDPLAPFEFPPHD